MEKKKTKTEGKEKQKERAVALGLRITTRGRSFKGTVVKKFPTRAVVEFERVVFIPKYERYCKKKTRLHARLPANMEIKVGDHIKIKECCPLSKIIHHIVIEKIRSADETKSEEKNVKEAKQEADK